jgi:hypothetical protein
MGGHLVSIGNQAEQDFLQTASFHRSRGFWIGFSEEVADGNLVWASDGSVTYPNWRLGEANDAQRPVAALTGEDCAASNGNVSMG